VRYISGSRPSRFFGERSCVSGPWACATRRKVDDSGSTASLRLAAHRVLSFSSIFCFKTCLLPEAYSREWIQSVAAEKPTWVHSLGSRGVYGGTGGSVISSGSTCCTRPSFQITILVPFRRASATTSCEAAIMAAFTRCFIRRVRSVIEQAAREKRSPPDNPTLSWHEVWVRKHDRRESSPRRAIKSAFRNSRHWTKAGRYRLAKVVLPAPFGPEIKYTIGAEASI
jgi:hypothetical protein